MNTHYQRKYEIGALIDRVKHDDLTFDEFETMLHTVIDSYPICGVEQRLFLDLIEKQGAYDDGDRIIVDTSRSMVDVKKLNEGE